MGAKLYVGNLSFKATEDSVRELFAKSGEVVSVNLITDPHTGRLKGFGFVEMASDEDAKKATDSLNGTTFLERPLTVNEAKPQKPRDPDSRGGGGRGGFGGGRGGGGGDRDDRGRSRGGFGGGGGRGGAGGGRGGYGGGRDSR